LEAEAGTMQRIFLTLATATAFTVASAATVLAADMAGPPIYAPLPAPPLYSWTGFYLGANLGGGWGSESHAIFYGPTGISQVGVTNHPDGVIGGGQIGYNWQFAPWFGWGTGTVLGIEADFQGSSQRSTIGEAFPFPTFAANFAGSVEDKLEWFGTVRARAGIAFDRVLWYATGGWAFGERKLDGPFTSTSFAGPFIATTAFSTSNSMDGWTVGGGIEWAFWGNLTAKFEYLYIDFGSQSALAIPGGAFIITSGHFIDNVVRAGVNYKF
jgi:outer membrane immunogenic protein